MGLSGLPPVRPEDWPALGSLAGVCPAGCRHVLWELLFYPWISTPGKDTVNGSWAACNQGCKGINESCIPVRVFFPPCCCSVTELCPTLCSPVDCSTQACLSFTISQNFLKLMSIELVMPSSHLILCRPRLLLPSIFPSIRVFSNELALCIRWPKYWNFSFSASPSNEYSGWFPLGLTGFYLLAVQRILKSLLQHHSSSILGY